MGGKRDGTSTLFFATTPSLRATSPQGEAFCKAPIEGSCRQNRLRGGDRKIGNGRPMIALTDLLNGKRDGTTTSFFATIPSLRATSPQGEAFCKAPIEGSCRQNRLRGGDRKIGNGRPMIAPTKHLPYCNIKTHKKTPPYRRCQKHIHIGGVNVLNGGVITTIKDVIYMKQISKIFVTFGGTLAFGEGKGI